MKRLIANFKIGFLSMNQHGDLTIVEEEIE